MKQVTAIIFLLIYLSAATELHQLVRLPIFFKHYQEHKQFNTSINLIDFIALHYFNSEHTDADAHQELPFNNNDCVTVALSLVILPNNSTEPPANEVNTVQAPILYSDAAFASNFHFSIWQPPRA